MSGILMAIAAPSSGARVRINGNNAVIEDIDYGSGPAQASETFASTGAWTSVGNNSQISNFTWLISGAASAYDFRYVLSSGSTPNVGGLTSGTWYNLGTSRTIGQSIAGAGFRTCAVDLYIRDASTLSVLVGPVRHTISAVSK